MSTTETTDGAATARGLSTAEARTGGGAARPTPPPNGTTRSYATILRTNVFSFFNIILFVIGVALLAMGRYSDALISVGLGLINALISAVAGDPGQAQARPAPAARPGAGASSSATAREVEVAPEEVVRGDVLRVRAGDQIVVDGPLLDGRGRGRRVAAHRRVRPGASRTPATTCGRAASAWRARATSSPGTSARPATPAGSPPRPAAPPPTPPRCSGGSPSSCGWSWR